MNDDRDDDLPGPTECGDPLCSGHIDETSGACVLCGEALGTVCWTCGSYGACDRSCPEREQ